MSYESSKDGSETVKIASIPLASFLLFSRAYVFQLIYWLNTLKLTSNFSKTNSNVELKLERQFEQFECGKNEVLAGSWSGFINSKQVATYTIGQRS